MNNLFTFKAGFLLLGLLICQIGLKAQTIDTALSKKANTSKIVKSDTTLVVKAGATLVQKADTTLVINADSSFIKKFNEAVAKQNAELAKKADEAVLQKANNTQSLKSDSAIVKTQQNPVVIKADSSQAKKPDVIIQDNSATTTTSAPSATVPATTSSAPAVTGTAAAVVTGTAGIITNGTPATTNNAPPTTNNTSSPSNNTPTDKNTGQPKKDDALQQSSSSNPPVAKPDSALTTVKVDTSLAKKTDTALVKKSDTTLMKKSDTSLMVKDTTAEDVKAQNVYAEVGGAGLAISANYDARFKKERNGWGFRVGAGFFTSGGNTVETVPFQLNYLIGEHSSMIEVGVGTTFLNSKGTNVGNSKWQFDNITGFVGTASIGYRYQPEHKGINFRIAFVPILYDEGVIPAGAVSIGYTFK